MRVLRSSQLGELLCEFVIAQGDELLVSGVVAQRDGRRVQDVHESRWPAAVLRQGTIDVVRDFTQPTAAITWRRIGTAHRVLAVSARSDLAHAANVRWADLAQRPRSSTPDRAPPRLLAGPRSRPRDRHLSHLATHTALAAHGPALLDAVLATED